MKRFLAFLLIAVMGFAVLGGCETAVRISNGTDEGVKTRADVVVCDGYDIVSLDPSNANDIYSTEVMSMIYESLLRLDEDGTIKGSLAENWEIAGQTDYIFYLRHGVKFHDGSEMKAQDVVFSLERAKRSPKSKSALEAVESIMAQDEYTVRIKTEYPYAPLLLNLTSVKTSVLSRKELERVEAQGKDYNSSAVGTGPMVFSVYKPNDCVVVKRNEDYWGSTPKAESITRRVIADDKARTEALEKGEIDYLNSVPTDDIKRIAKNKDLKTDEIPSISVAYIGLNTKSKPFDDIRVRQALHFATNKQKIIDILYGGYGSVCRSVIPDTMVGYNKFLNLYPYDTHKAEQLLRAAGYLEGFDMEIAVSSESRAKIARLLREDLKKLGINVTVKVLEFGPFLEYTASGKAQAFIMSWNGAMNHDMNFTANFHSASIKTGDNRTFYSDKEADKLIEIARKTLNWEEREAIYKEIQNIIMVDSPWIPLLQQSYLAGMQKGVKNVVILPNGQRDFRNMVVEN